MCTVSQRLKTVDTESNVFYHSHCTLKMLRLQWRYYILFSPFYHNFRSEICACSLKTTLLNRKFKERKTHYTTKYLSVEVSSKNNNEHLC